MRARTADDSFGPWDDPTGQVDDPRLRSQLRHAELFSLGMHGAALLYNLLVAERYADRGYDRVANAVDVYRTHVDAWSAECMGAHQRLAEWDRTAMWSLVRGVNSRIGQQTIDFVESWLRIAASSEVSGAASNEVLRDLVRRRELRRGMQSRLQNDKLLANWAGESGAGRLNYRWGTVRRLARDIHGALGDEGSRAGA